MAKTLNQQVRLLPPAPGGVDPIADDGEPYHSRLLLDGPRDLNNMASYVEPCFQFAMEQGGQIGAPIGTPKTRWIRGTTGGIPASGQAFICQMPILVPHQATRLLWTLDMYRGNFNAVEGAPAIQVSAVTLYLSPVPFRNFIAGQFINYPALSSEVTGNFNDAAMPTKFAKRSLSVSFTSIVGSPVHDFADDTTTGWTDFAKDPSVFTSSLLLTGGPVSWLIVAATYSSAAQYDYLDVREFSIWGQYE